MRILAVAAVSVALVTGCGAETPDYQSIWDSSTTSTTVQPTGPEKPVPIGVYLEQNGVIGAPMTPVTLKDITVTVPKPAGWQVVTDPNLPNSYQVLRKTVEDGYPPTALVMVFKLTGDFDIADALTHSFVSAQMSEGFKDLGTSTDDFNGMPSTLIECSYTLFDQRLHQYQRTVIPTSAPPAAERYLVQFSVTTAADQAAALAAEIEPLIAGFKVTVP